MDLRCAKEDIAGFNTERLYYHSINWLTAEKFGPGRLVREVTDAYLEGKFEHAGHKFSSQSPELTQAELDSIPGAAASMGSWDAIKFEVVERSGDKFQVKVDEHKFWLSQGGALADQYTQLHDQHAQFVKDHLTRAGGSATNPGDSSGQEPEAGSSSGLFRVFCKFESICPEGAC